LMHPCYNYKISYARPGVLYLKSNQGSVSWNFLRP